jgi:hypothetical protein
MITFKQYLTEQNISEAVFKKWSVDRVDVNTAISTLNEYAKDGLKAIQNGGVIYRGFVEKPRGKHDFFIMDSSTGERTSKDTDNLYQLMLSVSTKMKDYPDRSKSFICSTNKDTARSYGHAYVMVPYDGTYLAVSKKSDFFDQLIKSPIFEDNPNRMYNISRFLVSSGVGKPEFGKFVDAAKIDNDLKKLSPEMLLLNWDICVNFIKKSLKFKNEKFQQMYEGINYKPIPPDVKSPLKQFSKSTIETLTKLAPEIAAGRFTASLSRVLRVYEIFISTENHRFTALASEIMTPESTDLTLVKYGYPLDKNVECWFSGKCIAMTLPMFARILIELEKQEFPIHSFVKDAMGEEILKEKKKIINHNKT